MKLLVVTSSYPRFEGDIAGRFVLEWVEHLVGIGHEVKVLTWFDSAARGAPLEVEHDVVRIPYAPPGADTLFYGAGTPENIRQKPLRALLTAPAALVMAGRIAHEIQHFEPDVLVGHWLVPSGLLVRAAGQLTGVPTVVVGHSGGVHLLDKLPRPVARAVAAFVAAGPTTVPSLPLAEKLGRLGGYGAHVLPMGFEPVRGADLRPSSGERTDWLCMGRLVDIKGIDLAIEAFARADLPSTTTLHIAGDGPKRVELENLADALGANVSFHGFVTGEDRERLWARCGYALFASREVDGRHEGLPVSLLEACSRDIMPLCGGIPGVGAYLADRDLQEMTTQSVEEWARRIKTLAGLPTSEREELAERQRAKIAELEWPRLIERWDSLLDSARSPGFR
ncbi:glycosyltransferase [Persicimonas caeni]|nr:glycosyltransferase [Persicimonas caeni]